MSFPSRHKNANWIIGDDVKAFSTEHAQLAVLMDIRDELQQINRMLGCQRIPRALDAVVAAVVAMHKQGAKLRVVRKRGKK